MLQWPKRDPDTEADYSLDWSDELAETADTISTSTWSVLPAGVTLGSSAKTDTVSTLWVSGGDAGVTYIFTNRIVTAGGRTFDRSVSQLVEER